jgi:hypothetical protein
LAALSESKAVKIGAVVATDNDNRVEIAGVDAAWQS